MVYFAQTPTGSIKIGTTVWFPRRMKAHARRCAMALLGVHDGGPAEERAVHRRFAHLRLDAGRPGRRPELFRPDPELVGYVAENCRDPDLLDRLHEVKGWEVIVRLEPPAPDHKEFRNLAPEEETNMALLARRIIQEYIARGRKERSK
jgi:hypothetical protein